MTRRDWLMLLLGFRGEGRSVALDPVRVQKGMFLLAQEGGLPKAQRYDFEPYHYGPYSFKLRNELDALVDQGLVGTKEVPGYSWRRYHLTVRGLEVARVILDSADDDVVSKVRAIKKRVTGADFNNLLRDLYDEYPDYATRSIFAK